MENIFSETKILNPTKKNGNYGQRHYVNDLQLLF